MVESQSTSLSLLQAVLANEANAWQRLHHLYQPLVLFWCRRRGVVGADADDVCQEVFRTVTTALVHFRRDRPGDTFRGWMRGITQHKLQHWSERNRAALLGEGGTDAQLRLNQLPAAEQEQATDAEELTETRALYHRALEILQMQFEPTTWRAFWRTAVDGQPAPDIAAEMGLSPAAVRKAKSRVLQRLRQELGEMID